MVSYDELPRILAEIEARKRAEAEAEAAMAEAAGAAPEPEAAAETALERPHWQFQAGQSGNPRGRPRGAKNKRRGLAEALIESDAPELARLALDEARAGDKVMLRACLTRAVAPARDRPLRIRLSNGCNPKIMLDALLETQDRMMAGRLTFQEAREVAGFLTQRIAAHEAWLRSMRLEEQLGVTWPDEKEDDEAEDEEEAAPETDKRL